MSVAYIDTDVIIRLVTGDDPRKQEDAYQLFRRVADGGERLAAPCTVIADAVFVLGSARLYGLPRQEVRDQLTALVRLPGFLVENRRVVLAALDIYASSRLDFGDCMIIAAMREDNADILYSYDADFDRFREIDRKSPG
ncbi:MAG: PIN domain-containing protein [Chloroflexi bacterium]|nr:PIN domain-containing protein [Chloroflexota bacterium]